MYPLGVQFVDIPGQISSQGLKDRKLEEEVVSVSFSVDMDNIVESFENLPDAKLQFRSNTNLLSVNQLLELVPPVAMLLNYLVDKKALYSFRKQVGGIVLAANLAKDRGWAINVGGRFHHCWAEKGDGFCAYVGISLCSHYAFVHLNISRVMIIGLHALQGNRHDVDFSNDS